MVTRWCYLESETSFCTVANLYSHVAVLQRPSFQFQVLPDDEETVQLAGEGELVGTNGAVRSRELFLCVTARVVVAVAFSGVTAEGHLFNASRDGRVCVSEIAVDALADSEQAQFGRCPGASKHPGRFMLRSTRLPAAGVTVNVSLVHVDGQWTRSRDWAGLSVPLL